jgi:hypothetical protein
MAQKIVQYQSALQLAQSAPQLYDLPLLHRQMLEVLGIKNANKLIPTEDDVKPIDPVQENMNLLTMKPVKAFLEQNHQAHIAVHMSAIQDPKIQMMMQNNPQAQAIMAAAMAHVNEHVAFEYRLQVEKQMGMSLPPMQDKHEDHPPVPKDMADQIAIAAAQASQQLLQQNKQEAAQQSAQQKAMDPIVQMQQQELQLKMQEFQLKQQKQQIDAAAKADQLEIEKSRIEAQMQIAAMQVGATSAAKRDQLAKQQQTEGVRLGLDAAKHRAQLAVQAAQRGAKKENK